MLVHGFPDPQGSKRNKVRSHYVEERRTVGDWLILSFARLDPTDHGVGRGVYRGTEAQS